MIRRFIAAMTTGAALAVAATTIAMTLIGNWSVA